MPVIEHQALIHYHVLSYETIIESSQMQEMIEGIHRSVSALGLQQCGNIITTRKGIKTEFLVPVNKKFETTEYYKYKPVFRLVNALKVRHYGDFSDIHVCVDEIIRYINDNSLMAITNPYYVDKDPANSIYDVYIGVSENEL